MDATETYPTLTISTYVEQAAKTDRGIENQSLAFPLLGLFGETGSLLSALKKKQRDHASSVAYSEEVAEELGDASQRSFEVFERDKAKRPRLADHLHEEH